MIHFLHQFSIFKVAGVEFVYAEELKTYYPLHDCPVNVDRGVLPLLFLEVHDHLLCFVDIDTIGAKGS